MLLAVEGLHCLEELPVPTLREITTELSNLEGHVAGYTAQVIECKVYSNFSHSIMMVTNRCPPKSKLVMVTVLQA